MMSRRRTDRDDEITLSAKQRNSWDDGVRVRRAPAPWPVLVAVFLVGIGVTGLVMWLFAQSVATLLQLS
jgi:hypothetical protein